MMLLLTTLLWLSPAPVQDTPGELPLTNTIRWSTASEQNNFGFNVYRADQEDGPFTKLNEKPIAGSGTTDNTKKYAFVDDTIEAGKAYYYYVESISLDGVRERFTPVIKARAKEKPSETP